MEVKMIRLPVKKSDDKDMRLKQCRRCQKTSAMHKFSLYCSDRCRLRMEMMNGDAFLEEYSVSIKTYPEQSFFKSSLKQNLLVDEM